jgi:phage gp46-like protein
LKECLQASIKRKGIIIKAAVEVVWMHRKLLIRRFKVVQLKNTEKAEAKIIAIIETHKVKIIQVRRSKTLKGERVLHIKLKTSLGNYNEISASLVTEKSIIAFEG